MHADSELSEERLEALILAAGRLDRDAFGEVYRAFAPRIFRYIAFQVRNRALAEDLTNQVFLRAIEAIARYEHRSIGQFNAWLFRIAKNVVVDNWRAARNTVPLTEAILPSDEKSLDEQFETIACRDELRSAMTQLTDNQREVLSYRFALGLSHAEIAKRTGRNETAIRALQFRAIATLRDLLVKDIE